MRPTPPPVPPPVLAKDNLDLGPRSRHQLGIILHPSQILGLVGAAVLFVGVFMPIFGMPLVGSINYVQFGQINGVILLILAVVTVILALARVNRGLWATGLLSLGLLAFSFGTFQGGVARAQAALAHGGVAENPVASFGAKLGEIALSTAGVQWGWAVLVVGGILVVAAAVHHEAQQHPRHGPLVVGLGAAAVLLVMVLVGGVTWAVVRVLPPDGDSRKQVADAARNRPKQPREWYRAEWSGSFFKSRELESNVGDEGRNLRILVYIRTERDLPIKELYGHLAIRKDDKILHERDIAEKPDVSFTDGCAVIFRIPYDDNNPTHRTLRYAKDSELTLIFTVRKVVLADRTEKTFD
jgi:hypothetical protein